MRQVVLDTETTGLQVEAGHRIIEVGCIELINRKFTGKRFHHYINPEREVEEGAIAVHGISNAFLQDKPIFSAIADELLDFIQGTELIIHNAPFDVGFLNKEFEKAKKGWKNLTHHCKVFDTLPLARQLHVGQRNNLDALCKRYEVDNSNREFHGALLDAHLLAQVYLAMTGGQGSLFDSELREEVFVEKKIESQQVIRQRKLLVLHANEEELAAHEDRLKKLLEKGKCVWLEN